MIQESCATFHSFMLRSARSHCSWCSLLKAFQWIVTFICAHFSSPSSLNTTPRKINLEISLLNEASRTSSLFLKKKEDQLKEFKELIGCTSKDLMTFFSRFQLFKKEKLKNSLSRGYVQQPSLALLVLSRFLFRSSLGPLRRITNTSKAKLCGSFAGHNICPQTGRNIIKRLTTKLISW